MTYPDPRVATAIYNHTSHIVHDHGRLGHALCGLVTPDTPDTGLLFGVALDDFPPHQQCARCLDILARGTRASRRSKNLARLAPEA